MQVKLAGLEALSAATARLSGDMARQVRNAALLAAAEIVRADAARRAPRATPRPTYPKIGHMADHIIIKQTADEAKRGVVSIGPDKAHWYAVFVERGFTHQFFGGFVFGKRQARPFLRPALDENREAIKAKFRDVLNAAIERILAGGGGV